MLSNQEHGKQYWFRVRAKPDRTMIRSGHLQGKYMRGDAQTQILVEHPRNYMGNLG
jgi:hypothetical protein